MIANFAVLVLAALLIAGAVARELRSLHVKYALWHGFYKMPLTLNQITKHKRSKFVKMSRDEELNVDLYSYHNDPRLSVLFDKYGNIAGLRTAYIKDHMTLRAQSKNSEFPYTLADKPMYSSARYWDTDVWYTTVLFLSPDKLKDGGRSETNGLVAEDIYLKLEGKWTKISKNECEVGDQGFTKQGCFVGMGRHYFYKVTPNTECKDFQGVFLLFERGELIGLGIIPFGSFTPSEKRTWFENPPGKIVKYILPNAAPCFQEWVDKYGVNSMHIFFKRFPRLTFCMWPFQKKNQCK